MENTLTISQTRSRLLDLPKRLGKDGSITVTRRGKPVLAIIPWELYESLLETLEIMGDAEFMGHLREGIKQADEGKTRPWKDVKRELGL